MSKMISVLMLTMCMAYSTVYAQDTMTAERRWLKGRVTYTDGMPVPNAFLLIQNEHLEGLKTAIVDENGYYSFQNLVAAVESNIIIMVSQNVTYEFDYIRTNSEHDFILERADRYVKGQVVDHEGNPLRDYVLSVSPTGRRPSGLSIYGWITDDNGMFSKYGLTDDVVDIVVSAPEWDGIYAKHKVFEDVKTNEEHTLVIGEKDRLMWPLPISESQKRRQENERRLYGRLTGLMNEKAPELTVDTWIAGDPIHLSNVSGSVIVLHFWSIEDSRNSDKAKFVSLLKEEYAEQGLVCISIHEYTENLAQLSNYISENTLLQHVVIDQKPISEYSFGISFDSYGVTAIAHPDYIVIDKNGVVHDYCRDDDLEYTIRTLLSE